MIHSNPSEFYKAFVNTTLVVELNVLIVYNYCVSRFELESV